MASLSCIAVRILVLNPLVMKHINMKIFKVIVMPTDIQFFNLQCSHSVVVPIHIKILNHAIRLGIHEIVMPRNRQTLNEVTSYHKSIAVAINFDS